MTPPLIYVVAGILLGCIGTALFGAVCRRILTRGLRQELVALITRRNAPSLAPNCDEARITQRLQQAIEVELEYLAQRQLQRDEALAQQQRQWHADQEARHAKDMRALRQALEAQVGNVVAHSAATKQAVPLQDAPASIASLPLAMSARPPELVHTPLPRTEVAPAPGQPELELSDEEIDALPPELPSFAKPRRRILPAPRKPPMRSI